MFGPLITYGADESHATLALQWEDCQEIGFVQIDVDLAIDGRAGGFRVSYIEDLVVGSTWKSRAGGLANHRACAVTSCDVRRFYCFVAFGTAQLRDDTVTCVSESKQLNRSLDADAKRLQALDEQLLMLVLRKHLNERIGCEVAGKVAKGHAGFRLSLHPQVDGRHP